MFQLAVQVWLLTYCNLIYIFRPSLPLFDLLEYHTPPIHFDRRVFIHSDHRINPNRVDSLCLRHVSLPTHTVSRAQYLAQHDMVHCCIHVVGATGLMSRCQPCNAWIASCWGYETDVTTPTMWCLNSIKHSEQFFPQFLLEPYDLVSTVHQ